MTRSSTRAGDVTSRGACHLYHAPRDVTGRRDVVPLPRPSWRHGTEAWHHEGVALLPRPSWRHGPETWRHEGRGTSTTPLVTSRDGGVTSRRRGTSTTPLATSRAGGVTSCGAWHVRHELSRLPMTSPCLRSGSRRPGTPAVGAGAETGVERGSRWWSWTPSWWWWWGCRRGRSACTASTSTWTGRQRCRTESTQHTHAAGTPVITLVV